MNRERFLNIMFNIFDRRQVGLRVETLLDFMKSMEVENAEEQLLELEQLEIVEIYGDEIFAR